MKQICPVCKGRGNVPSGFYQVMTVYYSDHSTSSASEDIFQECRSCIGTGVISIE